MWILATWYKLSAQLAVHVRFTMFPKIELIAQIRTQHNNSRATIVNNYPNLCAYASAKTPSAQGVRPAA